ncbi:MAG TPA: peptide-methionine (R)-S-oxide reductase MsrB [Candidatus Acidoferrales bacterium]
MLSLDKHNEESSSSLGRRAFLLAIGAGIVAFFFSKVHNHDQQVEAANNAVPPGPPKMVKIIEFTDAGVRKGEVTVPMIVKSTAEWQKQLSPDSFEITREAGTERPYTNENPNNHQPGVFRCICCDTALYNADTKFESGTGWPSFWQPIAKENVLETTDHTFGMSRTAVSCRRCDAHLGHVFDDGPQPTGLRYCMNAVAMKFAKATA